MVKIAINGFGRIGRAFFRCAHSAKGIEISAINDLTDAATLAHLLKRDSVYGAFPCSVSCEGSSLTVNGKSIPVLAQSAPEALPWKKLGIDLVLESTGAFRKRSDAEKHISAGARRVLITAPPKSEKGAPQVKTIVPGINSHIFNPKTDSVVSMASCTTNSLLPIAKVLNDNFGIKKGFMTTVHAYTSDQRLLDAPHKDLRRARSAAINIIPTTTGAASAVADVLPELRGKLDGIAMRVPVANGSVTDFVAELEQNTTAEEINYAVKSAAQNELKDNLEYSEEPLVSSDIIGNLHPCVFDSLSTKVLQGNLAKTLSWYDNEMGYSSMLAKLVLLMAK